MAADDQTEDGDSAQAQSRPSPAERARTSISKEERRRRIEEAAYYYSLRRGGGEDRALDDWIQAEADVDRELAGDQPPAR